MSTELAKTEEQGVTNTQSDDFPGALPGRVIVRFPTPQEKEGHVKKGALWLPSEAVKRAAKHVAEVIDVGTPIDRADELFCQEVVPGDRVIAHPNYGTPFFHDSLEYRIYRMYEVIGKVRKP